MKAIAVSTKLAENKRKNRRMFCSSAVLIIALTRKYQTSKMAESVKHVTDNHSEKAFLLSPIGMRAIMSSGMPEEFTNKLIRSFIAANIKPCLGGLFVIGVDECNYI